MREIKFRGWDEEGKRMLPPQDLSTSRLYLEWLGIIDVPLMQYTGLKDKEGKDIYENDFVYLSGYGSYLVEFPFIELYQAYPESDIGIILGNTYENPELLEN